MEIPTTERIVGSKIVIQCFGVGDCKNLEMRISLKKMGKTKIIFTSNGTSLSHTIKKSKQSDSGVYYCEGEADEKELRGSSVALKLTGKLLFTSFYKMLTVYCQYYLL